MPPAPSCPRRWGRSTSPPGRASSTTTRPPDTRAGCRPRSPPPARVPTPPPPPPPRSPPRPTPATPLRRGRSAAGVRPRDRVAKPAEGRGQPPAQHGRHRLRGERPLAFAEGLQLVELAHEPPEVLADAFQELLEAFLRQLELTSARVFGHVGPERLALLGIGPHHRRLGQQVLEGGAPLVRPGRQQDEGHPRGGALEVTLQALPVSLETFRPPDHDCPVLRKERAHARGVEEAAPARLLSMEGLNCCRTVL